MKPKVKIISTLGPATNNETMIEALLDAGVNCFRLNFSYGTYEEHAKTIDNIRAISERKGLNTAILQDICGPKIRIKGLAQTVRLNRGDRIFMAAEATGEAFGITYPQILSKLGQGDMIYFADGTVQCRVEEMEAGVLTLEVLTRGTLKEGKGVNVPDGDGDLSALTQKDIADLRFGAKKGVDLVAISFVKSASDVLAARYILDEEGSDAWLVSKVERKSALENLAEIVEVSDGVMVARGDLGAEAGFPRVPLLQKQIIRMANMKAKPVITATQMLSSMTLSPYPTRAEVSDIANAVLDGTDAVMLSDETAVGENPIEAVKVLRETILETQKGYHFFREYEADHDEVFPKMACELSKSVPCDCLLALTASGLTAKWVAKFRPEKPIFIVTTNPNLPNRLAIVWGVENVQVVEEHKSEIRLIHQFLTKSQLCSFRLVVVSGLLGSQEGFGRSVRYVNEHSAFNICHILDGLMNK